MLRELYTNGIETTLAEVLDNSETGIDVTDASSWPTANFRVKVDDEIMFCTSRASNTLTVIRGAESTVADVHSNGAAINHIITAGALDAFKRDIWASMGYGRVPTSGNTYGDEFDDESFSGWTKVEHASGPFVTTTEQDNVVSIFHPGGGAAGQFTGFMKSVGSRSSGDWISICFRDYCQNQSYPIFGLFFADGATYNAGNQANLLFSQTEHQIIIKGYTGYNAAPSSTGVTIEPSITGPYQHLKLEYRGSNTYHGYGSCDGINWTKFFNSVNPANFTPAYAGFGITTWGGALPYMVTARGFRSSF